MHATVAVKLFTIMRSVAVDEGAIKAFTWVQSLQCRCHGHAPGSDLNLVAACGLPVPGWATYTRRGPPPPPPLLCPPHAGKRSSTTGA